MVKTVMECLAQTVRENPTRTAIRYKGSNNWQDMSWSDYYHTVRKAARGLCTLGLQAKDRTVILSYNRKEWVFADVASIAAGGVPAGVYPTSSSEQCEYIINHCKARCVFVEDQKQLDKILSIRDKLKSVQFIVLFSGNSSKEDVYTWDQLLYKSGDTSDKLLDQRVYNQRPDDLGTLVYTSGTTSRPKAVMLSQRNLMFMCEACIDHDIKLNKSDILLSYLPLSHIAEQMTTIHGPLYSGACVAFAESMEKLGENLKEIRPTVFLGVPRVWEKIQAKMLEKGKQASPLKRKIAGWAKRTGLKAGVDDNSQKSLSFKLANKLVFSKAKAALGLDRCRLQVTAAAPIAKETLEYFLSLNIPLYEIYGMSECTGPATISRPGQFKVGSTGCVIKGGQLRIADDGEILMKGAHIFMGYLNNEEATCETLDEDQWLHSGDLGKVDSEGFLTITGRKKNLIITAGGENIAPEMIENKLKMIPEIEQAVVVGDRRKYLSTLLTVDPQAVEMVKEKKVKTSAVNVDQLLNCDKFQKYIEQQIQRMNKDIARVQTVKKFHLLSEAFSEDSGELTPTMKVKRNIVIEKYASQIESMYA